MIGFQAAGAAPIYENRVIEEPRDGGHRHQDRQSRLVGPALEAMKDRAG